MPPIRATLAVDWSRSVETTPAQDEIFKVNEHLCIPKPNYSTTRLLNFPYLLYRASGNGTALPIPIRVALVGRPR